MRVAGASDVLGCGPEGERKPRLRDHLADLGTNHVHPQDTVGLGVDDDLNYAVGPCGTVSLPGRGPS